MKKQTVTFKSLREDNEGIINVNNSSKNVNNEYYQVYVGTYCKLYGLTGLPVYLLFYLLEQMNLNNRVFVNGNVKNEFLDSLSKESGTRYTVGAVDKALKKLKDTDIMLQCGYADYQMNPEYFWKTSPEERIKELKMTLTFIDQDANITKDKKLPHFEITRLYKE